MKTFFLQPSSLTVREIANLTGAVPRDGARLDLVVTGIAALDRARSSDLMYLDNTKYGDRLATTRGGVCLTTDRFAEHAPPEVTVLCTAQPFRDFVVVSRKLFPDALRPRSLFDTEGVAPGAIVHPAAEIEDGATIDPGAVIGPRACAGFSRGPLGKQQPTAERNRQRMKVQILFDKSKFVRGYGRPVVRLATLAVAAHAARAPAQ